MNKSEQINELAAALAKAQGTMEAAEKNAQNPHFRNRYADLASVWAAVRSPLAQNGLSVVQTIQHAEGGITLVTTLCHTSGQWISGELPLILQKQDMQGLGSALTYARRYSLAAICGIAQDDDDAEGAVDRSAPPAPKAADPRPPLQTVEGGKKPCCENCGTELVLSREGTVLYCPNFKDRTRGDHSRVPAPRTA